LPLMS